MKPDFRRFFRLQMPILAIAAVVALAIWYVEGAETLQDMAAYIIIAAVGADVLLGRFVTRS